MPVEDISLDRDDIKHEKFQSYKGKIGKKDRVGIVFDSSKAFAKGARIHYKDRYFMCKTTKNGGPEICCTTSYKGNEPRWRLGTVLCIYHMEDNKLKGYDLKPWVFSEKMYDKLRTANNEFPLVDHDITLTCTNEEFQNIDVQSCNKCFWRSKPELEKKILAEAAPLYDKIASNLASDLSIEEIRELLGIDALGSDDAAADVQMDDVLEDVL